MNKQTNQQTNKQANEQTNERTNEWTNKQTNKQTKTMIQVPYSPLQKVQKAHWNCQQIPESTQHKMKYKFYYQTV